MGGCLQRGVLGMREWRKIEFRSSMLTSRMHVDPSIATTQEGAERVQEAV